MIDRFLIFPFQLAVYVSAIVLVEVGTRAHKLLKRKSFDENLP